MAQRQAESSVQLDGPSAAVASCGAWCVNSGWQEGVCRNASGSRGDDEGGEVDGGEVWTGLLAKAQRTAATMLVGARVHLSVVALRKELLQLPHLHEDEVTERWDELHRQNADLVFRHIRTYRGFFVKVGQKASTMRGILPDPWVEALVPLQDKLPVTAFAAVRQQVQANLGRPLEELFSEFAPVPVASASIGQAHVARLRATGEKVCVKVLHPGVAELSGVDLTNIEYLAEFFVNFHDEAPDFREVVKEMRRSSLEEVDFRLEAQNAVAASAALSRLGLDVGCPEPLPQYSGPQVLTMRFVEGWKVTATERLPPGTDREALGKAIIEAFAGLVFDEGLIHGDPHPGNIFVEQVGEGVRPVFLDWGIVKRLSPEERAALARWVVASLSRDRFLYLSTLGELGVSITEAADLDALDVFMFTGMVSLRDTLPGSSMRQLREQFEKQREQHQKIKEDNGQKKFAKVVEKIPGWIHFFFRGLSLLQEVCGMLDITVPVARVMLRYALPLLGATASPRPALPGHGGGSDLQVAVRGKLQELAAAGRLLGAQVAVLRGSADGKWACSACAGVMGPAGAPVAEDSLMPLLDISVSVLVTCLLAALSKPTVTGKEVGLEDPVERLWPEFCRGGKGGACIARLLRHGAGLRRPFRGSTTHRTLSSERQMEDALAACPRDVDGASDVCHVVGIAAAALLRRATGHKTAAEALRSVLEPLGLHQDVVYSGPPERQARVGHQLVEEVTVAAIWDAVESHQQRLDEQQGEKTPAWLSWQELAKEQPWCVDPLLVNAVDVQRGRGCLAGRGLRATAKALCELHASDLVPPALLEESRGGRRLRVESREEWRELGRCIEVGAGWQLLRFRRIGAAEDEDEVVGHGHLDGATGSVVVRVAGASLAVLCSSADAEAPEAAHQLLAVAAAGLGLEPIWHLDEPRVPERVGAVGAVAADESEDSDDTTGETSCGVSTRTSRSRTSRTPRTPRTPAAVCHAVRRLEERVFKLTELIEGQVPAQGEARKADGPANPAKPAPVCLLSGRWVSAETEGLEELLDTLGVPALVRSLAKRLRRTLQLQIRGDQISFASTASVGSRKVEETTVKFRIGETFEGQQPGGGTFQGVAQWGVPEDGVKCEDPGGWVLVVEKRLEVAGRRITLEERFHLAEGRLSVCSTLQGGPIEAELQTAADRDLVARNLDPATLRLRQNVKLSGNATLWRGGLLTGPAPASVSGVLALLPPAVVLLTYEDLRSTTMFNREGPPPAGHGSPLVLPMAKARTVEDSFAGDEALEIAALDVAGVAVPVAGGAAGAGAVSGRNARGARSSGGCAVRSAARLTLSLAAAALYSLGHALENACADR